MLLDVSMPRLVTLLPTGMSPNRLGTGFPWPTRFSALVNELFVMEFVSAASADVFVFMFLAE